MNEKIIIFNHKMNLLYEDVALYIDKLNNIDNKLDLIVCPSNIYLESFINYCNYPVGIQDICYEEEGDHTGKVSAHQVKSMDINYAIIGHRELHPSMDNMVKKINVCLDNSIIPIVCIKDIDELAVFDDIDNISFIIVAYEPDTGYKKEDIDKVYNKLKDKYNKAPTMVYGGKVNKTNIMNIITNNKLNGVMIGSLSSDIDEVVELLEEVNKEV